MKDKFTYCFGKECPIKADCMRYREKINKKKQYWLDGPYDQKEKKCGFLILKSEDIVDSNDSDNGTEN